MLFNKTEESKATGCLKHKPKNKKSHLSNLEEVNKKK